MENSSLINKKIVIDAKYEGKTFHEIGKEYPNDEGIYPFLVEVNGIVRELHYEAKINDEIKFIYYNDDVGRVAYEKTAIFIMLYAFWHAFNEDAELKYNFENGYYFQATASKITDEKFEKIKTEFDKLVERNVVFGKYLLPRKNAIKMFDERSMNDVKLLFKYTYKTEVRLREVDGYVKYINGEILYSTGQLSNYIIKKFDNFILLLLPNIKDFKNIYEPNIPDNMYNAILDYTKYETKSGINTIGKCNSYIANKKFDDLIIMSESLQDKNMGKIADDIVLNNKRIICISGPSCSGKTSFSHRLSHHLAVLGEAVMPIAVDNFFVDRELTPKGKDGEYDFECLEAVDIKLLNDILNKLLKGEEVVMPKYDFVAGKKVFSDKNKVKLTENQLIILEGIHCLNPKLLPYINEDDKYTIFIAPLNKYAMDNANPISVIDLRLLRRIARDGRTRGNTAKDTIKNWHKVIEGDNKNIYPCIKHARVIFNSSVTYEFNVMKTVVLPLLYDIADDEEVGNTAKRLIKILNYVLPGNPENIPNYAIIREFIGKSILDVG